MILTSPFATRKDGYKRKMAYYDFAVKRENSFLRNVFDKEDPSLPILTLENYYSSFSLFVQVVKLLISHYSEENDVEDSDNDCITDFIE